MIPLCLKKLFFFLSSSDKISQTKLPVVNFGMLQTACETPQKKILT